MISKGDLVRMRLTVGDPGVADTGVAETSGGTSSGDVDAGDRSVADTGGGTLRELIIIGKVVNYTEDEETYIVEPQIISVPKDQVMEIVALPKDFDFNDVSMEMKTGSRRHERKKPAGIADVRFSRGS